MKKQIKKLQLSKSTVSNLSQQNMIQVKGGGITLTAFIVCHTRPKFCDTTNVSACTACYSCIECPPPPDTMYITCDDSLPAM
jgi:hypothetical protein